VATDGRVLWTRGLGGENDIEEIDLAGDFLVIVTRDHIRSVSVADGSLSAELSN
jgi:hypothetical protein